MRRAGHRDTQQVMQATRASDPTNTLNLVTWDVPSHGLTLIVITKPWGLYRMPLLQLCQNLSIDKASKYHHNAAKRSVNEDLGHHISATWYSDVYLVI